MGIMDGLQQYPEAVQDQIVSIAVDRLAREVLGNATVDILCGAVGCGGGCSEYARLQLEDA